MQYQPPDTNNPCNPLLKAVSLTLDKEHVGDGADAVINVIANLTFKHSNDFRGYAKDAAGQMITVCFGMAMRRASFQICFGLDDLTRSAAGAITLHQVAHHSSLASETQVIEESCRSEEANAQLLGELKGNLSSTFASRSVSARASGRVLADAKKGTRSTRRKKRTSVETNVTVTFSADKIHWEI